MPALSYCDTAGLRLPPLPPIDPDCRLCVTLPAKDEEAYLHDTLAALAGQRSGPTDAPIDPASYEIILLANNCSDRTAAVARSFAADHPRLRLHVVELQLPPEIACVGTARRLMMEAAASRLPPRGIICTTDADTLVDPCWVYHTLAAFDRGARAVGGRILVPRSGRAGYRKIHLQDVTYRSLQTLLESMIDPCGEDPWPRHFQHYGPSMAVRADTYLACGGMPAVRFIEDAAFGWCLERNDVAIVHDPAVRVYTSDRHSDRIDGVTFSQQLRTWEQMSDDAPEQRVIGLRNSIRLFKWKVALRQLYRQRKAARSPTLPQLTEILGITATDLGELVAKAPTFGALYQTVRQRLEATPAFSDSTFAQAIADLRRFTRSARAVSPASSRRRAGSDRRGFRVGGGSPSVAG